VFRSTSSRLDSEFDGRPTVSGGGGEAADVQFWSHDVTRPEVEFCSCRGFCSTGRQWSTVAMGDGRWAWHRLHVASQLCRGAPLSPTGSGNAAPRDDVERRRRRALIAYSVNMAARVSRTAEHISAVITTTVCKHMDEDDDDDDDVTSDSCFRKCSRRSVDPTKYSYD